MFWGLTKYWMVHRLSSVAASLGLVVDKMDTILSSPTFILPVRMLTDLILALDDNFSKLSLTLAFNSPRY